MTWAPAPAWVPAWAPAPAAVQPVAAVAREAFEAMAVAQGLAAVFPRRIPPPAVAQPLMFEAPVEFQLELQAPVAVGW